MIFIVSNLICCLQVATETTMRTTKYCIPLTLALMTSAAVADNWSGFYAEVAAGQNGGLDDNQDQFLFDTDLNGAFADTVTTATGANAFSPGFCDGIARDRTPTGGCAGNVTDQEWAIRGGYDWQSGDWVYGAIVEYARPDVRDAVSAFSTTPARYTMIRNVDDLFAIRGRLGFSLLEGNGLLYGTAGLARADIRNRFDTSNLVNTFVDSGDDTANGTQFGVGYTHRFGNWTIGLEYLLTMLRDDNYRVRAQGPAPASNPFIRTNASGTDFRRSDDDFDFDSIRLTLGWRF